MSRSTWTRRRAPRPSLNSIKVSSLASRVTSPQPTNRSSSRVLIATEQPAWTTYRHTRPSLAPQRIAPPQSVGLRPEVVAATSSPLRFLGGVLGPPRTNGPQSHSLRRRPLRRSPGCRGQDRDAHREELGPDKR